MQSRDRQRNEIGGDAETDELLLVHGEGPSDRASTARSRSERFGPKYAVTGRPARDRNGRGGVRAPPRNASLELRGAKVVAASKRRDSAVGQRRTAAVLSWRPDSC
ncbi:MAG TPA: hypothetical protein DCQ98_04220 [Planctomycetaceae bacterium]|nr:hypothetical protein [Planctomycetaceae bacterium]